MSTSTSTPIPGPGPDKDQLSFISYNPAGKTTLLLIHGAFSSPQDWTPLVQHLLPPHLLVINDLDPNTACTSAPRESTVPKDTDTETDNNESTALLTNHDTNENTSGQEYYHILVPSLPLHASSSHIAPLTLEHTTALLSSLISNHAKNSKAHVIGLSLGAHVAAALAHAHPDLVSTLFVSGFNIFPTSRFQCVLPYALFGIHGIESLVMTTKEEICTLMRWVMGRESPGVRYRLCEGVIGMLFSDRGIGRVEGVRVLVVAATKERWVPKDKVRDARRLFDCLVGGGSGSGIGDGNGTGAGNGSRVVQHRGLGHPWPVEEPELMARTVRAWVERGEVLEGFEDL